jgi:hypothetical protein
LTLQPYQHRVVEERGELQEKLTRLNEFINTPAFTRLHFMERGRLFRQQTYMEALVQVLGERIDAFNQPIPETQQ